MFLGGLFKAVVTTYMIFSFTKIDLPIENGDFFHLIR